jgi:large subunit ribosomal protein L2
VIDFRRNDKDGVPAKVAEIEYDPNRTARIALLHYLTARSATSSRRTGCAGGTRSRNPERDIAGEHLRARNIPVGTVVHAIESVPAAAQDRPLGRLLVQLVAKEGGSPSFCPSGIRTSTSATARPSARSVTPSSRTSTGKAGRMRWKGKRPSCGGR